MGKIIKSLTSLLLQQVRESRAHVHLRRRWDNDVHSPWSNCAIVRTESFLRSLFNKIGCSDDENRVHQSSNLYNFSILGEVLERVIRHQNQQWLGDILIDFFEIPKTTIEIRNLNLKFINFSSDLNNHLKFKYIFKLHKILAFQN